MSRRVAREELFKLLFESDMNKIKPLQRLDQFIKNGSRRLKLVDNSEYYNVIEEFYLSESEIEFIRKFAVGIDENYSTINHELSKQMEEWSLETIGNIERSLLRFAVYELMFEKTGFEIVLNEVIELAKIYGNENSHEFINGVLAKFVNNEK